jgi:hypothetical protein
MKSQDPSMTDEEYTRMDNLSEAIMDICVHSGGEIACQILLGQIKAIAIIDYKENGVAGMVGEALSS